jgi:hypothetical protein
MRINMNTVVAAAGVSVLLALSVLPEARLSAQITGQTPVPTAPPSGPPPRMANGKPDFQGVWQRPYVPDMTRSGRGQKGYAEAPFKNDDTAEARAALRQRGEFGDLPYTPAGLQAWKSYDISTLNAADGPGDYTGNCFPFGMTRSINSPEPMQIMQNDKYLALLFEQNSWFHVVPLDGREHPKGDALNPTWFGNSVGKWDGDTLVIDTVGFNGYTRLDTNGHPHSDQLHVVQTFRRTDMGHIEHTITVDDPKFYVKPWKNERTFTLMNTEILEYSCEENNRSLWEGRLKMWLPPWAREK